MRESLAAASARGQGRAAGSRRRARQPRARLLDGHGAGGQLQLGQRRGDAVLVAVGQRGEEGDALHRLEAPHVANRLQRAQQRRELVAVQREDLHARARERERERGVAKV